MNTIDFDLPALTRNIFEPAFQRADPFLQETIAARSDIQPDQHHQMIQFLDEADAGKLISERFSRALRDTLGDDADDFNSRKPWERTAVQNTLATVFNTYDNLFSTVLVKGKATDWDALLAAVRSSIESSEVDYNVFERNAKTCSHTHAYALSLFPTMADMGVFRYFMDGVRSVFGDSKHHFNAQPLAERVTAMKVVERAAKQIAEIKDSLIDGTAEEVYRPDGTLIEDLDQFRNMTTNVDHGDDDDHDEKSSRCVDGIDLGPINFKL